MGVAYKAAHAWASNAMQAACVLRRAGFEFARRPNWGYRCGIWLGASAPFSYEEAEHEARKNGWQFVRDFRAEQYRRALRDYEQASKLVAQIRCMQQQLSKKGTTT